MKQFAKKTLKHLLVASGYLVAGGAIALVAAYVLYVDSRPDLDVWHEARLDAEFTAESSASSFADYLAIEDKLHDQVQEQVIDRLSEADRSTINRFNPGSLANPDRWEQDWNRSFEWRLDAPAAGALLLHGMSDSPYSLRHIGVSLHERGAHVLGLRIPGHGTAPSGLVTATWQDMAAAVRLAVKHLKKQVGDKPVFIVGYSNGGALAVQYAQKSLLDPSLPEVDGLILLSPAIGISAAAGFAVWQGRLGWLLGVEKLAWASTQLEYDPFKYGSFAINAGDQAFRLTREIRENFEDPEIAPALDRFPPVLAFQSTVDATVSTTALIEGLFDRLPENGHELVLFGINREIILEELLANDPRPGLRALLEERELPFSVTALGSTPQTGGRLGIEHKDAGSMELAESSTDMQWPKEVFSLSHIALPFPRHDPLYGGEPRKNAGHVQLGELALRGERGTLSVTGVDMLRQRWNPFWDYLNSRVVEFTGLDK